jgi:peptidoglycan/LPS O-acetylase OafA/YrhL
MSNVPNVYTQPAELTAAAHHSQNIEAERAGTSSTQKAVLPARLQCIDVLRGLAALSVVICHCVATHRTEVHMAARAQHPWFDNLALAFGYGRLGVPLFFVISGFCIHMRWAKERAVNPSARIAFLPFWKRRLHRLYPPYFAAMCFGMATAWVQWRVSGAPEMSLPTPRGMLVDILVHIPMLHGLSPTYDSMGGNLAFWTLAREEYFYLAYFPLLWVRMRWGLPQALVLVTMISALVPMVMQPLLKSISGGAPWWEAAYYPFNDYNSAVALWIQWCLGMAAVETFYGVVRWPAWSRSLWLAALCLGVGIATQYPTSPPLKIVWPFLAAISFGLLFWILVNAAVEAEKNGRWRSDQVLVRWLAHVGTFSYSLYLVHSIILVWWRKAEIVVLSRLGLMSLEANIGFIALEWLASVVVCYFSGRAFFWLVERWFLPSSAPKTPRQAELTSVTAA